MTTSKIEFSEGSGLNIASHSFTEDSVTKHSERISAGAGVMASFDDTATVTATGLVSGLSAVATGKGRIIVGTKAVTGNTDYCALRVVYKNASGEVIGLSPLVQASFTELTSGGSPDYRYGTVIVFANDACAATVEVYVVTLPANGTLLLTLSAI